MYKVVAPKGQRCFYCDQPLTKKDRPVFRDGNFFCDVKCLLTDVLNEVEEVEVQTTDVF